ncbi:DNA repair protein RecO [Mesonia aestuariivivens]|uniref:DNA repair protein RecO n=1 Tax=Mesonia aestuariivivens TaxID=2796128 RepID=A0ABS6VXI8_9FLAO|nr:DNA repair protein RecO [Mesonia aestuariivivens]MBW2960303.1 DNA repair protein RecO [Mesonia aestuariivivens]
MLINTQAIIIHSLRYREADLIVKAFTKSSGLKSYLIRGVLKSKKGKLRASMFQPLTLLEVEANHKDKGTLENIREAKVNPPYQDLTTNVYKSSIAMFLAEVLNQAIQEEEQNEALYQYLENAFLWLDKNKKFANFHLLFMVKLSSFLGFYPHQYDQDLPYFNLLDGEYQLDDTNKYCIQNENSELLKQFLLVNFDEASSIKLNQSRRKSFLEMLILYFELHLHGFKKPRSLDILHQLF